MDYSYNAIYESYVRMCQRVGTIPPIFEAWMKERERVPENKVAKEASRILKGEDIQLT